jgi:hypothetical protein
VSSGEAGHLAQIVDEQQPGSTSWSKAGR